MNKVQLSLAGRILDAIGEAKKQNLQIVCIYMTEQQNKDLVKDMTLHADQTDTTGLKLSTIYGIRVKRGKVLSIATQIR